MKRITLLVILFALTAIAFAQAVEPNWNVTEWGESLLAFAGGIAGITAIIRKYLWKDLDGDMVKVFAVAAGLVVGVGLSFTPLIDGLAAGAVQGLLAGLASFLGVDALRGIVGGQGKALEG